MEYYTAIKKHEIMPFALFIICMDGPRDYHTKWSKSDRERQIYDIAYMGNLKKKWCRCKLLYIEWINNKVLLYSTGNYIQYPMINHNEKEY